MCWFVICPRTGAHLRQVDRPTRGYKQTLYFHNGALDAFFGALWGFQKFLAPHPRPPFDDLVTFVVSPGLGAGTSKRCA